MLLKYIAAGVLTSSVLLINATAVADKVEVLFGDIDGIGNETDFDRTFGLDSFTINYVSKSFFFDYQVPVDQVVTSAKLDLVVFLQATSPASFEMEYNNTTIGSIFSDPALYGSNQRIEFDVPVGLLAGSDQAELSRVLPENDPFDLGGAVDYARLTLTTEARVDPGDGGSTPVIPSPSAAFAGLAMLGLLAGQRRKKYR